MKSKLTFSEVKQVYTLLKKEARTFCEDGKYVLSWLTVCDAVNVIQQFNWEYCDDELEQLMNQLSKQFISSVKTDYHANDNRVVVVDDWCTSYVLVMQYIDALVAAGKEILYITSVDIKNSRYKNIIPNIDKYSKLTYHILPYNKKTINEWSLDVFKKIIEFKPSKLIAHINCVSPFLSVLYSFPDEIKVYRSNLDDQVFWLGKQAIDYSLEFRPFGVAVSLERRGLKTEQQLYVPYYPTKDDNPFNGFPELPDDAVVIFSGGDFYKTLDPNYTYWNLVKTILRNNPKAIFLYATKNVMGKTKEFLDSFIHDNHLENQFKYIGFRSDIYEVFAHIDIFMGTCPICGSLTSQLAAINHKPILQYYLPNTYDDETEQSVCYNAPNMKISFSDLEAFLAEANRLISDVEYRKLRGEEMYAATLKPEQFNRIFIDAITTNNAPCPIKSVDYQEVFRRWWWLEEMGFMDNLEYLYSLLKKYKLLKMMPLFCIKYNFNRFVLNKLLNINWYRYKLKKLCN